MAVSAVTRDLVQDLTFADAVVEGAGQDAALPPDRLHVNEALQANLLDQILLGLHLKQAHWNLTGPRFVPLHEFLDGLWVKVQAHADASAERQRQLMGFPDGNARAVADNETFASMPSGEIRDEQALDLIVTRLETLGAAMRTRLTSIEDEDTVTADMIHGQIHELEEAAWMLRSYR